MLLICFKHDLSSGNPPVRLVNGTDRCSGRVEVLHDGQWGTVCDDDWDIRDAEVVCRSMDCGTVKTAKTSSFFGEGQGSIWLDDVNCIGNETSLLHCQRPAFGENNCGHGEDAGVICSGTCISVIYPTVHRSEYQIKFELFTKSSDQFLILSTLFSFS